MSFFSQTLRHVNLGPSEIFGGLIDVVASWLDRVAG